jgi:acyl-homoserine lactone synthase
MEGNMVTMVCGATNRTARELLAKMFRQRHQVFVEEKGWKLKSYNGMEFDNYDTDETLYLMAFAPDGEIAASMRMIRTDRPHMLADVFAEMCGNGPPKSADTWELTRGALAKGLRATGYWSRIQCALLEAALLWGVSKGTGIFTVDYVTALMRMGWDGRPIGQPRMIDGEPYVACQCTLTADVLARTRALHNIVGPVLERIYYMPQEKRRAA